MHSIVNRKHQKITPENVRQNHSEHLTLQHDSFPVSQLGVLNAFDIARLRNQPSLTSSFLGDFHLFSCSFFPPFASGLLNLHLTPEDDGN